MANLRPKRMGLPFVVYVSPKGNVAHGPRIKASNKYGEKARLKLVKVIGSPSPLRISHV